jgi:uncharacterized membrane protein
MLYELMVFAHLVGVALIASGLIGVFVSDLRARQLGDLPLFAEAVRGIAVFYDGLVVPGAVVLAVSGTALILVLDYDVANTPWLMGMIVLFAFEAIEGNTVTRRHFTSLRRLTREAVTHGRIDPQIQRQREKMVPTFTHFLDLPVLFVIISLGAFRPSDWTFLAVGTIAAIAVAGALTAILPHLYPWHPGPEPSDAPLSAEPDDADRAR